MLLCQFLWFSALLNGFALQYLPQKRVWLTWIVESPPEKTLLLPKEMGQQSLASWLSACCCWGKVSPHSGGPVTGFLCSGSHQNMGSQLTCGKEKKEKREMTMHVFKSYSRTGLKQTYPPTNPEKVRPETLRELLPSFRCRKAGDYMAELKEIKRNQSHVF